MALELKQSLIQGLIGTLYGNSRLIYVVSNGKHYYNRTNQWDKPNENKENDNKRDDDDTECDGYISDCELEYEDEPDNIEEYKITLNDIEEFDFNYLEEWEDEEIVKTTIKKILSNTNNDKLFNVSNNVKIYLKNDRGINDDHRGSNHTKIRLDFNSIFQLKSNTLSGLLEGIYRVKSHKFDTWYELFCGVKEINISSKKIVITLDFDHGS